MRRLLLIAALLPLGWAAPPAPAWAQEASAEASYAAGQRLYLEGRYAEALARFEPLAPSSPNARLYVARCLRELGRRPAAYREMRLTLAEAEARVQAEPRFEPTRDAARAELAALEREVGRVKLVFAGPVEHAVATLNGEALEPRALEQPIPVAPGRLAIDVQAPGFRPFRHEQRIDAGESVSVAVILIPTEAPAAASPAHPSPSAPGAEPGVDVVAVPPASQPGGGDRSYLWGGIAATGVGILGGVVFIAAGVEANRTHEEVSEAAAACGGPCPGDDYDDDIDKGERLDIAANVGAAVGLAGAVAATVLFVLHATSEDGESAEAGRLEVLPMGAGAALRLRF